MKLRHMLAAGIVALAIPILGLTSVTSAVTVMAPKVGLVSRVAPETADSFTQMFADKNDMTWSGGDQMTSFKAPNGKVYWLSGDTMLSNGEAPNGSYPAGTTMVSNRILLQQGSRLMNAMANGGVAVPNPTTSTPENGEKYWTQAAFYANGYLYVLCQRVANDPASGFALRGTEMAKFSIGYDGKLTWLSMEATPSTGVSGGPSPAYTQWAGDAIVKDDYVYIYGYTQAPPTNPQWTLHYSYLARVPKPMIQSPSAWQFYKKSTNQWVNTVAELSTAVENPDAILDSQVSSVRLVGGRVVMVHKPWNGWGSAVFADVGPAPDGPFVRQHLFDSPAGTWEGKNYVTYTPTIHPEQTLSGAETGKVLVSICWNGVDFWSDTLGNADLYKPRFQAVSL